MKNSKKIIENSIAYLMASNRKKADVENVLDIDDIRLESNKMNTNFIDLSDSNLEQKIVLFNSQLQKRVEIVSFRINTPNVYVIEDLDEIVVENVQVSLIWSNTDGGHLNQATIPSVDDKEQLEPSLDFNENYFELLFKVTMDPLSAKSYTIRKSDDKKLITHGQNSQVLFYFRNAESEIAKQFESAFEKK